MLRFKTVPRAHQQKALDLSWDKKFFALLMDRGTGKTKVILDNAAMLYEKGLIEALLVIAPNEVHERWITEQVPIHFPDHIKTICRVWRRSTTKKYLNTLYDLFTEDGLKIMTMNVEAFHTKRGQNFAKNFANKLVAMVAVDESTRIKAPGAKRTKSIITLGKYAAYTRILTGNEITNSPFDVYSQFKFLSYGFWGETSFFRFQHRYAKYVSQYAKIKKCKNYTPCNVCNENMQPRVVRFFNRVKDGWDVYFECSLCFEKIRSANKKVTIEATRIKQKKGLYEFPVLLEYRNMPELRSKLAPHLYRVQKKDCLDLPEKIYDPIYAELNPEQTRIYKELKENFYAEFEEQELTVLNKMSLMGRFQQIVGGFFPGEESKLLGNPKMDRLLYDLEDIDEGAIIIWAIFRAEIAFIHETLRKEFPQKRTETYFGDTSKKQRKIIIDDFQKGGIDFLVANPESAGTGLNLQKSNLHYYFSNSFKAESRWQSEDRSHRDGQHWPVIYKDILIKGTIDDTIQKAVAAKLNMAEFFKDFSIEELV